MLVIVYMKMYIEDPRFESFTLIFLSVLLGAIPFIILGSFIASLISKFVTTNTINKYIPKNKYLGVLMMSFSGFVFSLCECSIVLITKNLIEKKLPRSMAIAFMLSVPVVNPVVFLSTYYAFQSFYIPLLRLAIGVSSGFIIGLLVELFTKDEKLELKHVGGAFAIIARVIIMRIIIKAAIAVKLMKKIRA